MSTSTNLNAEKQEHLAKLSILSIAAVLCEYSIHNQLDSFLIALSSIIHPIVYVYPPGTAFVTRLFSVLRFESVIHEFDPYFNYRTTRFLAEEGFYNFHNWFDDRAWYPLGRIIGGTIYPGLMVTSAALYRMLWLINFTVDIRNVCVFLAPFFSSLTTIVTYLLTKEIHVSLKCNSIQLFIN